MSSYHQCSTHEVNIMKKILFAIAISLAAITAFAQTTTITLTKEQAAALAQAQPTTAANVSENVRQEASAWGELGANMGKAMVAAAKEIGVAANEFSETNLGKITVAIVVYKLIGESLIGFVVGFLLLVFFFGIALWFLITKSFYDCEYEHMPFLWGMATRKVLKKFSAPERNHGEIAAARMIGAFIAIVIGLLTGLNVMF